MPLGHVQRGMAQVRLICPQTELLSTFECFNGEPMPRRDLWACAGWYESVQFVHAWWHIDVAHMYIHVQLCDNSEQTSTWADHILVFILVVLFHLYYHLFINTCSNFNRANLGPVVQSVVSLTSSLRVISLTVLADSIHNILIFFAEKMWVAFALQKLLIFFQQKISAYLHITRCKF